MTTDFSQPSLAFRAAHWVHMAHKSLFSAYRLKRCNIALREALDSVEREFILQFACALRQPELVVFDIGASSGVVSRALAKLSNVKTVHAFEPIPDSFQLLRDYVAGYPSVICHNVALGNRNQNEKLHLSSQPDSSSLLPMAQTHKTEFPGSADCREIEVKVARLDDFSAEHQLPPPDVMKIDVQGY
ncbi:MAG TPA: FkbM family methyltransferase, partial [Chthoniobacter sp.]|nr:FkbM family methyltransferase [Chthoniobacter sp.]